ncbi:MAG: hypothetical protein ABR860_14690 [Terracidiphilus sp.]|jgi:hypothetical protein
MAGEGSPITTGNISGTGIAVGAGAQATVTINQQVQKEVLDLLSQLRDHIQNADLPEGAKKVLLEKAVPEMEQAVHAPEPKAAMSDAIGRINDQLQGVGAVAKNVSGIVETVSKIAGIVGIGVKIVAPFLAGLL